MKNEFYNLIDSKFAKEISGFPSAAKRERAFRYYLELANPKIALEIGTCLGISTALIAQYADKVYTFDKADHPIKYKIWEFLGVSKKITPYIINNETEKSEICGNLEFDFAFIDGCHSYEGVLSDFNCVKNKCSKILFDDYGYPAFPGIVKLIQDLEGYFKKTDTIDYFAYIEKFI